jgi:hypothetical protein
MKELGFNKVKVVLVDNLTAHEATALGLALNRTAELSDWNEDTLSKILHNLRENEFDLTSIGFDTTILDEYYASKNDDIFDQPIDPFRLTHEAEKEFSPDIKDKSESSELPTEFALKIIFENDEERQLLFFELRDRGLKVKAV